MARKIYCLMQTQVVLTDEMSDALYDTACEMYRNDERRAPVMTWDMEGQVRTSYERTTLVWITGVMFTAEVETDLGKGKVTFIVRTDDMPSRDKFFGVRITDDVAHGGPSSVH
jgi:hypothetical protein